MEPFIVLKSVGFFLFVKIEILLAVLAYVVNLSHATKVMNLKKLFVTH